MQTGTTSIAAEYVLVLVERGAVPFCHYDSPHYHSSAPPQWISDSLLRKIIRQATGRNVALTFVLGRNRPPPQLEREMNAAPHLKIVPLALNDVYPGAMLVLSSEESESFSSITPDLARNLTLRLARDHLGRCAEFFSALTGKFGRLTIQLQDIEHFTEQDLSIYAKQLARIADLAKDLYAAQQKIEINILTDRILLKAMRNCEAGEKHLTVAPDGQLYICPGFAATGEKAVGTFHEKKGFVADVPETVAFSNAPLCTRCDAWHCKRCVFLSRKLTLEYNVPSMQQCLIAHAEREASRLALNAFGDIEPFRRLPRIVELNYRDPLDLIEMTPPDFGVQQTADDPML